MDSLMEEIERIFRQSQDENWSYEEECGEKPVLYKGAIFLLNLFSLGFLIFCQVAVMIAIWALLKKARSEEHTSELHHQSVSRMPSSA